MTPEDPPEPPDDDSAPEDIRDAEEHERWLRENRPPHHG